LTRVHTVYTIYLNCGDSPGPTLRRWLASSEGLAPQTSCRPHNCDCSIRSTPVLVLSSLSASMHSPALKPISIALCPSADRSTLIPNTHQQHYLSPPLTPFLTHLSHEDHSKHPNSLQSYFPPSLPAIRDMLPPERRPDTVPTEPLKNLVYSASAPERRSQLELTETLDPIPSSIARGTTSIPDPNRLQQVFSSQPLNGIPASSSMLSPLLRRNKAHVASACVNCKKAHLACDGTSPCVLVRRSPFRLSTVVASRWLSQLLPTPLSMGADCDLRRCGGMWMHVKRQLRALPSVRDISVWLANLGQRIVCSGGGERYRGTGHGKLLF
jgi:hypothetical protein